MNRDRCSVPVAWARGFSDGIRLLACWAGLGSTMLCSLCYGDQERGNGETWWRKCSVGGWGCVELGVEWLRVPSVYSFQLLSREVISITHITFRLLPFA
jgi:hypothetical protein